MQTRCPSIHPLTGRPELWCPEADQPLPAAAADVREAFQRRPHRFQLKAPLTGRRGGKRLGVAEEGKVERIIALLNRLKKS
jgi:hypothetical protein